MQPQLVRELGSIIRNQVSVGRKSILDAYGDILFRAWRDCTGVCLVEVENLVQVTSSPSKQSYLHQRQKDGKQKRRPES